MAASPEALPNYPVIEPQFDEELWEMFPTWYQYELGTNFPFMVQQVLGYLKESGADIVDFADFQYDWIRIIERKDPVRKKQKDLVIAFRDSAKTTFFSFLYPLHYIHTPHRFIYLLGDAMEQSKLNLENIETFVEEWEPIQYLKGSTWNKLQAKFSNGSRIHAKSLSSPTRGGKTLRERPSLIICDDLIPDKLKMPMQWYIDTFHSLIPALARIGRIVLVGTPFNPTDLIADIESRDDWNKFKKALIEKNVSTWEAKISTLEAFELKANTPPLTWARNYDVTPIFSEGVSFNVDWLRTCDWEWTPSDQFIRVVGVDPAIKKVEIQRSDPDYFAITILDYFYRQYVAKIIFQFRDRLTFPDQKKMVKDIGTDYMKRLYADPRIKSKGFYCVVEANFYQAALGQELQQSCPFNIIPFDQTVDKIERISELTIPYQNAEIWHAGSVHSDYSIEFRGFPRKDIKRDMLDTVHLAFFWAKIFGRSMIEGGDEIEGADYED